MTTQISTAYSYSFNQPELKKKSSRLCLIAVERDSLKNLRSRIPSSSRLIPPFIKASTQTPYTYLKVEQKYKQKKKTVINQSSRINDDVPHPNIIASEMVSIDLAFDENAPNVWSNRKSSQNLKIHVNQNKFEIGSEVYNIDDSDVGLSTYERSRVIEMSGNPSDSKYKFLEEVSPEVSRVCIAKNSQLNRKTPKYQSPAISKSNPLRPKRMSMNPVWLPNREHEANIFFKQETDSMSISLSEEEEEEEDEGNQDNEEENGPPSTSNQVSNKKLNHFTFDNYNKNKKLIKSEIYDIDCIKDRYKKPTGSFSNIRNLKPNELSIESPKNYKKLKKNLQNKSKNKFKKKKQSVDKKKTKIYKNSIVLKSKTMKLDKKIKQKSNNKNEKVRKSLNLGTRNSLEESLWIIQQSSIRDDRGTKKEGNTAKGKKKRFLQTKAEKGHKRYHSNMVNLEGLIKSGKPKNNRLDRKEKTKDKKKLFRGSNFKKEFRE